MQDWKRIATRVLAVLIGLRALTNIGKPLGTGTGLVFFGVLLGGVPNLILAPLLGAAMLVYAFGMWRMRRFALPMGIAYAVLVVFNVVLFPVFQGIPARWGPAAYLAYGVVAIAGPAFTAWLLWVQRDRLS